MLAFTAKDATGAGITFNSREALAPLMPDYIEDVVLVANTLQRIPIPTGAKFVVFSFDGDFRAKIGVVGTTLALPTVTTTNGSGSELNPGPRSIPAKLSDGTTVPTHIIIIAAAAQRGSLAFYG